MGVVLVMGCFPARGLVVMREELISLEWAVERADAIVRGNVLLDARREFSADGKRQIVLEVMESLKGDVRGTIVFPAVGKADLSGEGVVFLSGGRGKWSVYRDWAFSAKGPVESVYRMDLERVWNGAELVAGVREAVKSLGTARKAGWPEEGAVIPTGNDMYSGAMLRVPADARLEALGRRWVENAYWMMRIRGVVALRAVKSEESTAHLRALFADPEYRLIEDSAWNPRLEGRAMKYYPVRAEAARAVYGYPPKTVVTESAFLRYRAVAWGKGLAAVASMIALAWLCRRAGVEVGFWRWVAIGSMVMLVGVGMLAWRGVQVCDSFSFAAQGLDWEVTFGGGQVAVLRVQDQAPPHGAMVRRYEPAKYPEGLWYWRRFAPLTSETKWKGFYAAEGMTDGGPLLPYRLMIVPYWMVAAVLAVVPGILALGWMRARIRRAAWVRTNRCGRCGYDLRGLGGRCPECGAGVRVIPRWSRGVGITE
jgi:hypothetical protein